MHDIRQRRQLGHHLRHPFGSRSVVDPQLAPQQAAACLGPVIRQHHPQPGARRHQCRHQPGRPGTGDQQVAMGKTVLEMPSRRRSGGCRRQPRRLADRGLVKMPVRPFEGLVVEPRRYEPRNHLRGRPEVEPGGGPAIDRARHETLAQRHGRRQPVGACLLASQLHQRGRLLDPGTHDAARAMVLETARGQPHPVGQQGRGQRVARIALVAASVEGEGHWPRPVDAAPLIQPLTLHRHPR